MTWSGLASGMKMHEPLTICLPRAQFRWPGQGLALRALVSITLFATQAAAAELGVPALRARVNDYAGILSRAEQDRIERKLADFESQTTHQIGILTVASLGGEDIAAYSLRVAKAWGLGQRGYSNGILVTVATEDRKIRIELGRGMEAYISNDLAKSVIDSKMRPWFRQGQYARGLDESLDLLMAAARHYRIEPKSTR